MDKDIQTSCPAADPQPVVQSAGMAAIFIVLSLADGDEAAGTARDALGEVPAMLRTLNLRLPGAALSCVIGIGHDAWPRLFPDHPRPKGLHPMKAFKGAKHTAPATPGDLLLHIRATRTDACFELAMRIREQLGDAVVPVDEVHGFRYLDARSMVGFVDGTENPQGQEAVEARSSATRTRPTPAAATSSCRSTFTTWRPGTRCRWSGKRPSSAARSRPTSISARSRKPAKRTTC